MATTVTTVTVVMTVSLFLVQTLTEGSKVTLTYELNRYTLKVLECKPAKGGSPSPLIPHPSPSTLIPHPPPSSLTPHPSSIPPSTPYLSLSSPLTPPSFFTPYLSPSSPLTTPSFLLTCHHPHPSPLTPHPHPSSIPPHPSHITPHTSPLIPQTSLLTPHSLPVTPHPSLLTLHSSPLTPHSSPSSGISILDADITTDIVEPADMNRYVSKEHIHSTQHSINQFFHSLLYP